MYYNMLYCIHKIKTKKVEVNSMYMSKEEALANYKQAKKNYLDNNTYENWIIFCDARTICMRLGVRI